MLLRHRKRVWFQAHRRHRDDQQTTGDNVAIRCPIQAPARTRSGWRLADEAMPWCADASLVAHPSISRSISMPAVDLSLGKTQNKHGMTGVERWMGRASTGQER